MSSINWQTIKEYEDITFKQADGVARIAFNRPECRNAFRPKTVDELLEALVISHEHPEIGVVLITGEGPSPKDGGWAFCSGGDQRVRAKRGYQGLDGVNKFNILDVQRQIRFMNKVVIAVVPGWAVGGGHSLHVVCDMTIASKEHAVFKQKMQMLQVSMVDLDRHIWQDKLGKNELVKYSSLVEIIQRRRHLIWGW